MRSWKWTTTVVAIAALTGPGAARAASPATPGAAGAKATAAAYVAALRAHDARAACRATTPAAGAAQRRCRGLLSDQLRGARLFRARVEPGSALVRDAQARAVADIVLGYSDGVLFAARARVLLRRAGGRWRIVSSGPLPRGRGGRLPEPADDPVPSGTTAALRRLADDELLALSQNGGMLCALLAPGAPLAGDDGCQGLAWHADDHPVAPRATRVAVHLTGSGHARLDVAVIAERAVRSGRPPGWSLRRQRWSDTVYVTRVDGRWRLVKPSRGAYLVARVRPPADVGTPAATATWPDATEPSLSERPVPDACRRPEPVWGASCEDLDSLVLTDRLVAWGAGASQTWARPVAAGAAAGPVVPASVAAPSRRSRWWAQQLAPVADGALLIEGNLYDHAVRVTPLGLDGRSRGPAQTLAGPVARGEDDADVVVVDGPAGAATADVVDPKGSLVRLGSDGRAIGPAVKLGDAERDAHLLARPDGTLLAFAAGYDGEGASGLTVRALGADGRPRGAEVVQSAVAGVVDADQIAAAETSDGHLLVAWVEERRDGDGAVRAWAFDPAAPNATASVTVATLPARNALAQGDADGLDVAARADGGWNIAWGRQETAGRTALWAEPLPSSGAPVAAPTRVVEQLGSAAYRRPAFGLVDGGVVWVAPKPVAGLPQVRIAPLP